MMQVSVKSENLQCPRCGVPVDVVTHKVPRQRQLSPCGHWFTSDELMSSWYPEWTRPVF